MVLDIDRLQSPLYIESKVTNRDLWNSMTEEDPEKLELAALEVRVDELIRTVDSLANENEALRHQQTQLTSERATLIEKTEAARIRVEAMISRLKAMETR